MLLVVTSFNNDIEQIIVKLLINFIISLIMTSIMSITNYVNYVTLNVKKFCINILTEDIFVLSRHYH